MTSDRPPSRRALLIGLARRCRLVDRRAAVGRCLAVSLELAAAARRRGLAVSLVRWKIRGDDAFADHWAVRLDALHVVDPTHVQVGGRPRLVVPVDDYPADFHDRRDYPAALFLAAWADACPTDRGTLPAGFQLAMARAMFRHDVVTALRGSLPARLLVSAAELGGVHLRVARATLAARLEARRDGLLARLG